MALIRTENVNCRQYLESCDTIHRDVSGTFCFDSLGAPRVGTVIGQQFIDNCTLFVPGMLVKSVEIVKQPISCGPDWEPGIAIVFDGAEIDLLGGTDADLLNEEIATQIDNIPQSQGGGPNSTLGGIINMYWKCDGAYFLLGNAKDGFCYKIEASTSRTDELAVWPGDGETVYSPCKYTCTTRSENRSVDPCLFNIEGTINASGEFESLSGKLCCENVFEQVIKRGCVKSAETSPDDPPDDEPKKGETGGKRIPNEKEKVSWRAERARVTIDCCCNVDFQQLKPMLCMIEYNNGQGSVLDLIGKVNSVANDPFPGARAYEWKVVAVQDTGTLYPRGRRLSITYESVSRMPYNCKNFILGAKYFCCNEHKWNDLVPGQNPNQYYLWDSFDIHECVEVTMHPCIWEEGGGFNVFDAWDQLDEGG